MHQTFRLFVAGYLFLGTALPWPASAQPASLPPSHVPPGPPASMVDVAYAEPTNAVQRPLYERLRKRQVLENLREFLSPLRLPHRLVITMQSCNRANAFYSRARVTICYEYIELIHQRAPKATTPEGVTYEDAVVAGVVSVVLHEVSHAVFDLLQIPILGREEDAADQLAGFIMVQFGKNVARRTIAGKAHLWDHAGSKRPPRTKRAYADVHGTEYQRFYNILCIAYGHDPENFEDYVKKNILPAGRARRCRIEYRKIERAFRTLLLPHIDRAAMERVRQVEWVRPEDGRP